MGHSSGNSCYVTVQMLLAHLHLAWHFFISLTLFLPCFLRMQSVSIYLYCLLQTLRSQSTGHVKCLTYSPMVCLFFPCMLEGVKRHCTPFPHLLCQRLGISWDYCVHFAATGGVALVGCPNLLSLLIQYLHSTSHAHSPQTWLIIHVIILK